MGETKPEMRRAGMMKQNMPMYACCWVEQQDEMAQPIPASDMEYMPTTTKSAGTEPCRGTPKA